MCEIISGGLARSDEFLRATENSIRPNRMADRECILRFLAFYMDHWSHYSAGTIDLNAYLTNAMRKVSEIGREDRDRLAGDFKKAMGRWISYLRARYFPSADQRQLAERCETRRFWKHGA